MDLFGSVLILIWFLWTAVTVTQGAAEVEKARDRKNRIAVIVFITLAPIITALPFIALYRFVDYWIV